jgi:uncharacterized protein
MRLVVDTNVLISALVFKDSRQIPLREAWEAKRVTPLLSIATYRELKHVLCYRMFALEDDRIQAAIERIGPHIEWVAIDETQTGTLPKCSDRDDQKFLDVALCGRADALVTYDKALLKMRRRDLGFRIGKPEEISSELYG